MTEVNPITPDERDVDALVGAVDRPVDSSDRIYHLRLLLHRTAVENGSPTIVDELSEVLGVLAIGTGRVDDDRVIDLVIESKQRQETITAALEASPTIDAVFPTDVSDHPGLVVTSDRRPGSGRTEPEWVVEDASSDVFEEIRESVQPVEFADLIDDPEYLDFLDSFDELEFPDDEISFAELMDESAVGRSDGETASPSGSTRGTGDAETTTDRTAAVDAGELVDRLVAGIRRNEVSETKLATLREELGVTPPTSLEIRLDHVQARLQDVDAYTDALEAFLDENGADLIEDCRAAIDGIREDLATVESELAAATEQRAGMVDRIETLEAEIDRANDVDERLDEFEAALDAVRKDVTANREWQRRLEDAFRE